MVDKSGSSSDVYAGSICIKEGSNAKNNIFYIDPASGGKKPGAKSPPKLSKSAMESYRKWQGEAEKQGGPNAKIVVSKPEAKRIILEMLHDDLTPMNINEM